MHRRFQILVPCLFLSLGSYYQRCFHAVDMQYESMVLVGPKTTVFKSCGKFAVYSSLNAVYFAVYSSLNMRCMRASLSSKLQFF